MSENATMDALFASPRRDRGCTICGENVAADVTVLIREREGRQYGKIKSKTASLCDRHAVEVFGDLSAQIPRR